MIRLKSKVAWTTTLILIGLILKHELDIEITNYDIYIELLIGLLIEFGILNNPTDKNKF
jgi:uncharacterized membrane protein